MTPNMVACILLHGPKEKANSLDTVLYFLASAYL